MQKLPKKSTIRNKADDLVTPIAIKLHPRCELCGAPSTVGHHFIFKSKSSLLRYTVANFIGLCRDCHFKLHHNETECSGAIQAKRGQEWFTEIQKLKNQGTVKTDVHFYIRAYEYLTALLKSL